MARKDLLASVTASLSQTSPTGARSDYVKRGASRSMMQSLDELAESSLKMLDGETIVSITPEDLDGSFVADRIDENDEEYQSLKDAIRQSGQSTPILVRPHPDDAGRYMIVFGHRRARVARDLGIAVRAIIKPLADVEHVIAQGQENTARADLSFIEKAIFARKLLGSGMTKKTVKAALTVDDTLLSRMLSVAETVPETVLDALGAAKGVGRDRWEELKKLVQIPANANRAVEYVEDKGYSAGQTNDGRFKLLLDHLKPSRKPRRSRIASTPKAWAPQDKSVCVAAKALPKGYVIDITDKDAKPFGEWISNNLDSLYEAFRKSEK